MRARPLFASLLAVLPLIAAAGWPGMAAAEPPASTPPVAEREAAASDRLPLHGETVLQLATIPQAREVLGAEDLFSRSLSSFDRQSRLQSDKEVSNGEFLRFAAGEAQAWTDDEREKLAGIVRQLREDLAPFRLPLPPRIWLIKTSGREEGNAAYCRHEAIVLPQRVVDRPPASLRSLLAHELFHILSRGNPRLREQLYAIIGFRPCEPIELPPALRDRKITNPDAPRVEHYITLQHGGREVHAAPILYARTERYRPEDGGPFFRFLEFRLMVIERAGDGWRPLLVDGKPVLINARENVSYFRQIGRNTDYIIHPDEILADNFVLLVLGNPSIKTPRIVEAMRRRLQATE